MLHQKDLKQIQLLTNNLLYKLREVYLPERSHPQPIPSQKKLLDKTQEPQNHEHALHGVQIILPKMLQVLPKKVLIESSVAFQVTLARAVG